MTQQLQTFFNLISQEYDDLVARSIPRYSEMFWAMFYYLPQSFQPRSVLELGCGTGNLTRLIRDRWPDAAITVVDLSDEMLAKTAQKLENPTSLTCVQSSFEEVSFTPGTFDLVMSSIALHHVEDAAKVSVIQRIAEWLAPGGFFVLGDQVRGATERLYQADVQCYETYAVEQGASSDDVSQWREHRETYDHYATLDSLVSWMRKAGLVNVDVLWRYCFYAVLQAQKP